MLNIVIICQGWLPASSVAKCLLCACNNFVFITPWFEIHHTPSLFLAQINFAIMFDKERIGIDINLDYAFEKLINRYIQNDVINEKDKKVVNDTTVWKEHYKEYFDKHQITKLLHKKSCRQITKLYLSETTDICHYSCPLHIKYYFITKLNIQCFSKSGAQRDINAVISTAIFFQRTTVSLTEHLLKLLLPSYSEFRNFASQIIK